MPIAVGEIVVTAQKREENVQDVPISVSTLRARISRSSPPAAPDVRALSGPCAEPDHRVVLRSRLPALLHPRSRQHRLRPQRLAAGVDDRRRGRAREPGGQGHAAVGPGPGRGPARTPGNALRPQHPGRHRQVRHASSRRRSFDAFVQVSYGTFDTIDIKGGVGGALSDTCRPGFSGLYQSQSDWVDNQHDPAGRTTSAGYDTTAYRAAVPVGAEREVQRPAQPPRLGRRRHRAHLPRQHHRAGHQQPGRRLRAGPGSARRPQRAGHRLPRRC